VGDLASIKKKREVYFRRAGEKPEKSLRLFKTAGRNRKGVRRAQQALNWNFFSKDTHVEAQIDNSRRGPKAEGEEIFSAEACGDVGPASFSARFFPGGNKLRQLRTRQRGARFPPVRGQTCNASKGQPGFGMGHGRLGAR